MKTYYVWQLRRDEGEPWIDSDSRHDSYRDAVVALVDTDPRFWRLVRRTDEALEARNLPGAPFGPAKARVSEFNPQATQEAYLASPIERMNALIANFNAVAGASIAPVHAGEMVDFSVLRVMMGMIEAITKVLDHGPEEAR